MKAKKKLSVESMICFENDRPSIDVSPWDVYTSNNIFSEVFKKKNKEFGSYPEKKRVVKITSLSNGKSIYRFWNGASKGSTSKDTMYVDVNAKYDLIRGCDSNCIDVSISKGSKFCFYYYHYDHMVRISFKLAVLSLALGCVSLVLGIIPLIFR